MMKQLTTAMKTSISEVMETMFYLPVEFGEELTIHQSGMDRKKPNLACQLEFFGDFSGRFTLLIPRDLLTEMTANFMGKLRETLDNEHIMGTLTETLNMICGNALSRLPSKIPFKLNIPKILDDAKIPESDVFTNIQTPESKMAIHIKVD